jgi:uncharacterized protein YcbK (DUF882 family)
MIAAPGAFASSKPARDRELSFYNIHTGEKLTATYWSKGDYLDDGLSQINWLLRDYRTDGKTSIDPKLLDLLHRLQAEVGQRGEYHVISGYRSPKTNAMLASKSSGVAKHSYHMLGQAIDICMPGYDTKKLYKAAKSLKSGGVGLYTASDFIHVDTGRVRYW